MTVSMAIDAARSDRPMTVLVKRWPQPARRAEWERALSGALARGLTCENHLGTVIFKPTEGGAYRLIVRFRSRAAYEAWRRSPECGERFAALVPMETRAPEFVEAEGPEAWFDPGDGGAAPPPATAPPRWKTALVSWLGVYPTITVLVWLLWPAMAGLPMSLRTLVLSGLMVPLLAWIVMPPLTRLLRPWLVAGRQKV